MQHPKNLARDRHGHDANEYFPGIRPIEAKRAERRQERRRRSWRMLSFEQDLEPGGESDREQRRTYARCAHHVQSKYRGLGGDAKHPDGEESGAESEQVPCDRVVGPGRGEERLLSDHHARRAEAREQNQMMREERDEAGDADRDGARKRYPECER